MASSFSSDEGARTAALGTPEEAYRAIRGKLPRIVQQQQEIEIERAIKNAKRTEWDKWFRKQWYRAAARRGNGRLSKKRAPQRIGRCPWARRSLRHRWTDG